MVPWSIRRLLRRLRWRERWLGVTWAASRWLAGLCVALAAACLIDYAVDRAMETPVWLQGLFFVVKAILVIGLFAFAIDALVKIISDRQAALWTEEAVPDLRHRLISAVELNQPEAKTEGMSPELIAAVTRQAEERANEIKPADVRDGRRLTWAAAVLTPALLASGLLYLLSPDKAWALLQRQ